MDKSSETTLEKPQNFKDFPTFFSLNKIRLAVFLAVVLTIGCPVFYFYGRSSAESQSLSALNEAFRMQRPAQTRISGMDYAPLENKRGKFSQNIDEIALESAKRFAVDAVRKGETAESLHSLSRVYLAEREFDKAETQLEKIHKLKPESAEILNDLGIVYLEKSKKPGDSNGGKQLELQAKALENFERSIEIKPDFAAAVFNRAICLQTLSLPNQTAAAWNEFLKLDVASNWSDEARQNLETLMANKSQEKKADELLQDFMQAFRARDGEKAFEIVSRNREMITGKLIPQRLTFEFLDSEDSSKQEYLDALKYIGNLEKQKTGDPFFAEIAEFYSNAPDETLKVLRIAQISVKNGYEFSNKSDYENSFNEFLKAREIFEKNRSFAEVGICDYWLAYLDFQSDKITESNERLEKLAEICNTKKYKWLASQTYFWLSTNARVAQEVSKSFQMANLALKFAEETSDFYNIQKTFYFLADSQTRVKKIPEALANMHKALDMSHAPDSSSRQNWRNFDAATQLFFEMKLYRTAAAFEKEGLALNALQIKDLSFERVSSARLSRIYGYLKKYDDAINFAEKGRQAAEKLKNEANRKKGIAFAFLQIADLEFEQKNYAKALEHYAKSIEIYNTMQFSQYEYEAKKGKLLCYLAEKNDGAIQKEMPEVLKLFNNNRSKILEEKYRSSFFSNEQNIYDLAIDYEFNRGNYETAFDYSENSRARSLLDLMKKGGKLLNEKEGPEIIFNAQFAAEPLSLSELRAKLPENVQLVQYAVLPDKTVVWIITKENLHAFSIKVSSSELSEKVIAFISAIKDKDGVIQNDLSVALHKILFQEAEAKLDKNKETVIIPDKILFHLPFAALISEKTQSYLVSEFKISFAPSVNVFSLASENAETKKTKTSETFLGIGNPSFDRQAFPDYENLPQAEKEISAISELYPEKKIFLKENASKEKFIKELSGAEIIHFAGHYIVNEESSLLSGFLVAGKDAESLLANFELLGKPLENSKLIILSACRTGIENYHEGEGMIGAGRTFLALGVPRVVASQWEVETTATAELMQKFHHFRKKENLSTTSALQRAQLEMLNHPQTSFRQPFYWAGFLTLGGYSQF